MNLPLGRIVPNFTIATRGWFFICLSAAAVCMPGCCFLNPEAGLSRLKQENIASEKNMLAVSDPVTPTGIQAIASGGAPRQVEAKTTLVSTPAALVHKDCCVPKRVKSLPLGIRSVRTYVTAGPNISFMSRKGQSYGDDTKKQPGIGFQLGFASIYQFSDRFSVTPALLFKQVSVVEKTSTGYTPPVEPGSNPTYGSAEYKSTCTYNYLSAPIMAEYSVNENLRIAAGPEINYLLKATEKTSGSVYGGGDDGKQDITDNSVKVGVGVQVGVKYNIPNSVFGLQLVYDHRITPVDKEMYYEPVTHIKTVQLGVTCLICNLLKGLRAN